MGKALVTHVSVRTGVWIFDTPVMPVLDVKTGDPGSEQATLANSISEFCLNERPYAGDET